MEFETQRVISVADGVLEGNRRAIGRAISMFENDDPTDTQPLMGAIWPHTGRAMTVGITGPPGAGKSTLVSELIRHLRAQDKTVGVLAVDPSSSLSGGALLGDRIRMNEHALDKDVFIRSMSTRGHLGGVAEATFLAMSVLDAAGKDVVMVETVGVGQSEVDVQSLVDTVAVVLQPGSGDSIQTLKSGLMEIPDIICLNKVERPEASATVRDLNKTLLTDAQISPLFVKTSALNHTGLDDLWSAIEAHRDLLGEEGLYERRRSNLANQMAAMVTARLLPSITGTFTQDEHELLDIVLEDKTLDPLGVVEMALETR